MVKVTFIQSNGGEKVVEIEEGFSLMEGAVRNSIEGIDADCGGSCTCATCHVYVAAPWMGRLPARSEDEETMLEYAVESGPQSRLSCQIKVSSALDGLVVRIPKTQR